MAFAESFNEWWETFVYWVGEAAKTLGEIIDHWITETINLITESWDALWTALISDHSLIRNGADGWSQSGRTAVNLEEAKDSIEGDPSEKTGREGLVNKWTGKSWDAADLMHQRIVHALTNGNFEDIDSADVDKWGEIPRFSFMTNVLNDHADVLERGVFDWFAEVGAAAAGVITVASIISAVATGGLTAILIAIAGALVTLASTIAYLFENVYEHWQSATTFSGAANGMDSHKPNFGPEWKLG